MLFKEPLCLYSYDIIYTIIFRFRYRCFYIFTAVSQIPGPAIVCILFLNQNFQFFSDHGLFIITCMAVMHFDHLFAASGFFSLCQLSVHGSRLCSLSSGIFEDMSLIKTDAVHKIIGFPEFFLRFLRKAYDHIRCQCRISIHFS